MASRYEDLQYYKFSAYGFLKNLKFFEAFFMIYLRSRGLSFAQIGTLYAVREVSINLLEIPTGLFADGWGRKKTMLLSFLSYIGAFLLLYTSAEFLILLPAMVLYAFGDACRTGTHKSMIFSYITAKGWGEEKSLYYGNTRAWSQRGSAVSAVLGAVIVLWGGDYSLIFLYSVIPYILDFFLILSYPSWLDRSSPSVKRETSILKASYDALRNRTVLMRVNHVSIFAGFYKAAKDYLQPILQTAALALPFFLSLKDERRSAILIGIVYFLVFLMTSRASREAGAVHKRYGDRGRILFMTLILGALTGGAAAFFLYINLPWLAVLALMLIFVLENIRKPVGVSYMGDSTDHSILATVLSVESQSETVWTAVFAMIMGLTADYLSLSAALGSASLILLLMSVFFKKDREFSVPSRSVPKGIK